MSDILDKIVAVKHQEVAAALARKPLVVVRADAESRVLTRDFVGALRAKVANLEQATTKPSDPGYVARYREFKYQETLFELLARQYETARVDEGREGALVQVVDVASPAERKFKPKRSLFAGAGLFVGLLLSALWVLLRPARRQPS